MPFREAVEEVERSHHTVVGEATCRRITYRSGQAAEALTVQEVLHLQQEGVAETTGPAQMTLSADGSFIRLTSGAWREVKGMAIGRFETVGDVLGVGGEVKTQELSYFTRSYRARDFETYALAELARRGLGQAETVVAVNDGATWLQSFVDYHCPQAVRILDFAHALGHVAEAGKAIWGEGSEAFTSWFNRCAQQLKHQPPQRTLAELSLLRSKAKGDVQTAALDNARRYLQRRFAMIDYPFFQQRGYPIGSGAVESAHKQVVQRRMKQAGMRWAPHHVDPLLALRDLLSNGRWDEGWEHIVDFQLQQQRQQRCQRALAKQPTPVAPLTFPALQAAGLMPDVTIPEETSSSTERAKRDPKDHPWRNDRWPTKESWRWSKFRQQN